MKSGDRRVASRRSIKVVVLVIFSLVAFPLFLFSQSMNSPGKIESQEELLQWITYYYSHKDNSLLVPGIRYIMESKILEKGDTGAPILSFLGSVFKQNEDKIEGWVRAVDNLGIKEKEWLWIAVAWSNTTKGLELLERLQDEYEGEPEEFLKKRVKNKQYDALVDPIKQPFHLDVMWGNFSATGDERYVKRVIDVLPWFQPGGEAGKAMIGASARWSLTSNAVQHPKVMEICKKNSVTATEPLKSILNDIIKNAEQKLAKER
jgi:hypothetical protein